MDILDLIAAMEAAEVPADKILSAVKILRDKQKEEEERKLALGRDRVRRHRNGMKRDVTLQSVTDVTVTPTPPDGFISPTPPFTSLTPLKENPPKGGQKKVPQRGDRLSPDWRLPQPWGAWAESQGLARDEVIRECQKFRDYWISKPGQQAVKLDWEATWRNWIRRRLEEQKS